MMVGAGNKRFVELPLHHAVQLIVL